jgi:anti-anti-sigma factor
VPDLEVRLHTPIPQVVIVRVAGTVDRAGAALLTERVGQQLTRADHVVLDLAEVAVMGADGVRVLCDLHRQASAYGTALHLAGADQPAINGPLRAAGMDQLIALAPSADAVIALLHRTAIRRTPLSDDPRHQRIPGP